MNQCIPATETINRLGLNIDKLKELRMAAIHGALDGDWNPETSIDEMIQVYSERQITGNFLPYCSAIVSVLENLL